MHCTLKRQEAPESISDRDLTTFLTPGQPVSSQNMQNVADHAGSRTKHDDTALPVCLLLRRYRAGVHNYRVRVEENDM